jgi:hypothetical protein
VLRDSALRRHLPALPAAATRLGIRRRAANRHCFQLRPKSLPNQCAPAVTPTRTHFALVKGAPCAATKSATTSCVN